MRSLVDQAFVQQSSRRMDVGKVEDLDFRPDAEIAHLKREVFHQAGVIFVDDRRKIHRPGREGRHIGT